MKCLEATRRDLLSLRLHHWTENSWCSTLRVWEAMEMLYMSDASFSAAIILKGREPSGRMLDTLCAVQYSPFLSLYTLDSTNDTLLNYMYHLTLI